MGLASWLGAKDAPVFPAKKPDLKMDSSPVSDSKGPVVTSYADVIEPVQKCVVSVNLTKIERQRMPVNPLLRQFFGNGSDPEQERKVRGLGSGVIVSSNGYILTNNHVVADADELKVTLTDNRQFTAKVIGSDPGTDVAVIKIDVEGLPVVTLADSDKLRVGDLVFAIGNPLEVGQTVTMGIVSATGRNGLGLIERDGGQPGYENFIQTDAAINMGNSGGALIDAKGRLIGINTAILSPNQGNIGIGFAIPVNLASSVMRSLIETGKVQRGYLGVGVDNLTPDLAESLGLPKDTKGVVITNLADNAPAKKAGLKREDIITSINDKSVNSLEELRLTVSQISPETKVKVKIIRGGKPQAIDVVLGKLADETAASGEVIPGVKLSKLTEDLRKEYRIPEDVQGLIVAEADGNSPIPVGAVIVQINRDPATDFDTAAAAIRKGGQNFALVYFKGAYRFVPFPVK